MTALSTLVLSVLFVATLSRPADPEPLTVLFFGDSITAGYGLDPEQAFPALIQERADSLGLPVRVVNAGVSGETSAGGLARVDWILRARVDVFVLELGGNDALRGIPPDATYSNLRGIVEKVRELSPGTRVLLTGMEAPPNMGQDYTGEFRQVYTRLAREFNLPFMPFVLQDVGGVPELNQADGIHPTVEGHRIIADNLWPYLEPLVRRTTSGE